jgi:hypothetical protein
LNVYIQNVEAAQSEVKVWSVSRGAYHQSWQQAHVPVTTQYDFAVVLEASRPINVTGIPVVYVDDVHFSLSPCPTTPTCYNDGPENCTFETNIIGNTSVFTACSWADLDGSWLQFLYRSSPWKQFAGFGHDKSFGRFTSRIACSN